jgi:CP family cyanate transporter-like MFS transporter
MKAFVLLWLAGNGSRISVLAIPPILSYIILDLQLSGTEVGILNGIPVAVFAVASVPGSLLIARVGAVPALIIGLLIAAAGSALRGVSPGTLTLFLATVAMSGGIAIMQPALPPAVRQWAPNRIGFATAVYTNGLLVGEIIPVALAAFLMPLLAGSWRANLILWSIPLALIAAIIFLWQPKSNRRDEPTRRALWMPDWSDPLLWKMALVMAGANETYFCTNAFLPGYLLSTDRAALIAPALTSLNAGQFPASLLLLVMASRWERRRLPLLAAGVLALVGTAGIAVAGNGWVVVFSAALCGFACAMVLTLVLALPALLVAPDDVPRMSAGVFTIGYSIAMTISVIAGATWDLTGKAVFAFVPVAVAVLPVIFLTPLIDLSKRRG